MKASGILRIGEAQVAVGAIVRRQNGGSGLVGLLAIFVSLGVYILASLFLEVWMAALLAAAVALTAGWIVRKRGLPGFKREFLARGHSLELPTRFELLPDAVVYVLGDITTTAPWRAVDELFLIEEYWIFMVQAQAYFAPKRFFADADAERSFLKFALSHMTDAARSRSEPAMKYLEGAA